MQDGYSTGNGLGLGLPGTRRLMDDFELETDAGQRAPRIRLVKWSACLTAPPDWPAELELRRRRARARRARPLGRPRRARRRTSGGALVAAIDGLGHGGDAADAAATAGARCSSAQPDDDPTHADRGAATAALRRTRGVVMTLAWFDLDERPAELDRRRQRRGPARARGRRPRRADRGRADQGRRRRLQPAVDPRDQRPSWRPATCMVLATDGDRLRLRRRRSRAAARRRSSPTGSSPSTARTDDALVVVVRYLARR